MFTRKLGRSEIEVSAMGLGCWAIGGPWWYVGDGEPSPSGWGRVDDAESIHAIHAAMDLGVNFFDTADAYGCGHSERVLGKAVAGRRDRVVIATKFGKQFDEEKKHYFGHETNPALIRKACEASLRRLNTDVIDLYQFHWGDYDGDALEVCATLEALVAEGKIRAYGWSTDNPENARIFSEGEHCSAIQQAIHVAYTQSFVRDILTLCENKNLASINRGPLAMGLLTGKFTDKTTFPEDDIRHDWNLKTGRLLEIRERLSALREILTSGGRTLAQGALAWLWACSPNTIPIPGFKNVQQATENSKAMEFGPLTGGQFLQIEEIMGRIPEVL